MFSNMYCPVRRKRRRRNEILQKIAVFSSSLANIALLEGQHIWALPRNTDWWANDASNWMDDDDRFYHNFRMRREPFNHLVQLLRPHLLKNQTQMRKPISPEKRLAITLHRLAKQTDLGTLSEMYGVGVSTVCTIHLEVCKIICKVLTPIYGKKPDTAEMADIVEGFKTTWGFPQCGGSIDGCHIPILPPTEYHTDFFNRKQWHCVILQAVVDYRYRFIDFDVGWPGKCHDAWVFEHSQIGRTIAQGRFYPELTKQIDGVNVPVVLVGDAAYPLSKNMMKPYPEANLTHEKRAFNFIQSRSRMVVENAFGRLKYRWRCLMKRNDSKTSNLRYIIVACILLHNFCEVWGDPVPQGEDDEPDYYIQPPVVPVIDVAAPVAIRDVICRHFANTNE